MKANQLNLFHQPTFNVLRDIKASMATAVDQCGRSREQVCDAMNDLAERYGVRLTKGNGSRLSLATLEKWLNQEDKEHIPSIKALPIFCAVVDSIEPLRAMVEPLGWQIIGDQDAKLLAWAKQYHRARDARKRMKRIEAEL